MDENHTTGDIRKSLGELKPFVRFTRDGAFLNYKKIEMMRRLAGRFLIVTNTDMSKEDAVKAYKEQWMIERSFRTMKSFIEIRPVYHWKTERIRAPVFVFVLSLLVSRLIERSLQDISIESVADVLSYIKAIPVRSPMKMTYCSGSVEASGLLERMGIRRPERILTGALPNNELIWSKYPVLERVIPYSINYFLAKVKFKDYNEKRPHSSIDYLPPREFRRKFLNDPSFREEYAKKLEVKLNEK